MVGMGAMVGGGTGAAMTAVTMIFEMTRDYDIVLPMILAVAVSVGVRRVLSRENIYTLKLCAAAMSFPRRCMPTCFSCAMPAKSWTRMSLCVGGIGLRRVAGPAGQWRACAMSWYAEDGTYWA